jgi:hypothetical protein
MQTSALEELSDHRVYRQLLLWRISSSLWLVLVLFIALGALGRVAESVFQNPITTLTDLYLPCLFVSVFSLMSFVGILNFWITNATRLVISAKGIEYHVPGYTIYAHWVDVDHIWKHWYESLHFWHWPSLAEKLILRRSRLQAGKVSAQVLRFSGSDRIIPIGRFAWDWRNSDLAVCRRDKYDCASSQARIGFSSVHSVK